MTGDFFLTTWILMGMRWLYENVTLENIVMTIILSTLFIRGLTIFGDIKSRKSTMKMQALQPEIDKLQKKYKNNPQKLQQAQSKLMRDRGVSMWGGCLPMLITMPLFFCFIAAFRHWGYEQQVKLLLDLETSGSIEMFESFKFLWVNNIWQPDVGHAPVIMDAEQFLTIPGLSNLLYFNENPEAYALFRRLFFANSGSTVPAEAIANYNRLIAPILERYTGYNNGWYVLPVLAGGTTFLSSWLMQRKQQAASSNASNPAAGTGKAMLYAMPIMSFVFCLSNNAAFAVYWTISNIVGICTNYLLNKKFDKDREKLELEASNT